MYTLLIDALELRDELKSGDCLVLDVRHDLSDHDAGIRAYQAGHIPGARYLNHETQLSAPKSGTNGRHPLPDRRDFAALMLSHGLTATSQVVVYDANNAMFAAHVWWMLRWLGHERVAVLDGGWEAWLAIGGAIETTVTNPKRTEAQAVQSVNFTSGPSMPTVDAQAVQANIDVPGFVVIDARSAERFRGEKEPIDPVAGHIPGAMNRPNSENVQENGRFKPKDVLRREFEALLQGRDPTQVVHQCGSGITACHNLFAMELAGLSGSGLYPGSWSEWCADAARPVARA